MSWLRRVRSGIPFLPKRQTTETLWHKCRKCGTMVFLKEWEDNLRVCPRCDHHDRVGPKARFDILFDAGRYELLPAPEPGSWENDYVTRAEHGLRVRSSIASFALLA